MKKIVLMLGLALTMQGAWAGNAANCLQVTSPYSNDGLALKNTCNETVEATWCFGKECQYDNMWTIRPGMEMPLDAKKGTNVRYDGCKGANTLRLNKGGGAIFVECR